MYLRKLSIESKSDLEFVEKLYIESFPQNERRPISRMHNLIEKQELFDVYLLLDDTDNRIGFFTLWTFDTFVFLEHFAISPDCRNAGHGKLAIQNILDITKLPLIAEIELPDTSELALRRKAFYERQGFKAWDIAYEQPPYEEGGDAVPLMLMTFRDINLDIQYMDIKNEIYSKVYQI